MYITFFFIQRKYILLTDDAFMHLQQFLFHYSKEYCRFGKCIFISSMLCIHLHGICCLSHFHTYTNIIVNICNIKTSNMKYCLDAGFERFLLLFLADEPMFTVFESYCYWCYCFELMSTEHLFLFSCKSCQNNKRGWFCN